MLIAAPLSLIALIPWLGVTLWLLSGSRQRVHVPFLPLWQGRVEGPRTRTRLHMPPAAIAFILAAILLAILAASRPQVRKPHNQVHGSFSFILDRGLTMSAHGTHDLRFREAADQALTVLHHRFADCQINFTTVPEGTVQTLSLDECDSLVRDLPPSAMDTRELLADAIRQTNGPVLVVSDEPLDATQDRAIEIPPPQGAQDVAIVRIAAREAPVAQIMISLRNQSSRTTAVLAVSDVQQRVRRQVDLPPAPAERNYVIDLPQIDPVILVQLETRDDVEVDKQAWLVREGSGTRVEPHFALPPELRRLVDVYVAARPPAPNAGRLCVVRSLADAPADAPAVIVPPVRRPLRASAFHVRDHFVTHNAGWQSAGVAIDVADDPPPQGWTPLVNAGGRTLVAARPTPPNQIWVGFDSPQWAATPDFVIFWTNVLDWAGGGAEFMAAHSLPEWDREWKPTATHPAEPWPGLYQRSDGTLRAFNAPDVPIPPLGDTRWREGIAALAATPGRIDLSPDLLIAALACLALAALAWASPRKPLATTADEKGDARL